MFLKSVKVFPQKEVRSCLVQSKSAFTGKCRYFTRIRQHPFHGWIFILTNLFHFVTNLFMTKLYIHILRIIFDLQKHRNCIDFFIFVILLLKISINLFENWKKTCSVILCNRTINQYLVFLTWFDWKITFTIEECKFVSLLINWNWDRNSMENKVNIFCVNSRYVYISFVYAD